MGTSLKGKQRVVTISATGYKEMSFKHILNAYAYLNRIAKANLNKAGQTTIKIKATPLAPSPKAKTRKVTKTKAKTPKAKTPKVTKTKAKTPKAVKVKTIKAAKPKVTKVSTPKVIKTSSAKTTGKKQQYFSL